jgi:voltage-gated potassium channel
MSLTQRLMAALALLTILLTTGTIGYQLLVGGSSFDGLYMTVITLSTVGFGEIVPGLSDSTAGRAFTMVMILLGMGLLLWIVSTLTAFFVEGELSEILKRRKLQKNIDNLDDHIIVCGAGTIGIEVIRELHATGAPCIAVDIQQERIDKAMQKTEFMAICGDATAEETLLKAGIEKARGVVTVLHEDKDNLVVTFIAHQIRPDLRIVARGREAASRARLKRAGASAVVFPNHIGGLRLVSELIRPHVVGFLDRMLRSGQEGTWRIEEVEVTDECAAAGKTLGSLNLAERSGMPVLAMTENEGRNITYYPAPETVLKPRSRLVVMGERQQVETLRGVIQRG